MNKYNRKEYGKILNYIILVFTLLANFLIYKTIDNS